RRRPLRPLRLLSARLCRRCPLQHDQPRHPALARPVSARARASHSAGVAAAAVRDATGLKKFIEITIEIRLAFVPSPGPVSGPEGLECPGAEPVLKLARQQG